MYWIIKYIVLNLIITSLIVSTILSKLIILISTVSIIVSIISITVLGPVPLKNKNYWACQPCIQNLTAIEAPSKERTGTIQGSY